MVVDLAGIKINNRPNKYWRNIREFSFDYWWLAIIALLIRRIPFAVFPPADFISLKKAVLIISYPLLILVLLKNWRYISARLILVGVAMNFIAILANGGLMPVSPEARDIAGMLPVGIGQVLPHGSGILLPLEQTRLWFLTDIIPVRAIYSIFSLGDVIMLCGLVLLIVEVVSFPKKAVNKLRKPTLSVDGL
jgi:Family of unknown function (DUF5317)